MIFICSLQAKNLNNGNKIHPAVLYTNRYSWIEYSCAPNLQSRTNFRLQIKMILVVSERSIWDNLIYCTLS